MLRQQLNSDFELGLVHWIEMVVKESKRRRIPVIVGQFMPSAMRRALSKHGLKPLFVLFEPGFDIRWQRVRARHGNDQQKLAWSYSKMTSFVQRASVEMSNFDRVVDSFQQISDMIYSKLTESARIVQYADKIYPVV